MDKTSHSSNESLSDSNNNSRDQYLKHLNKLSHKISKPTLKKPTFDLPHAPEHTQSLPHAPPQHQPPVYNINKNDFREVVQKLTGSPAHERLSSPPPIQPPKPPSSRLQRIRPPPLAHLSPRPSSLLNGATPTTQTLNPNANPNPNPLFENPIANLNPNPNGRFAPNFNPIHRPSAPLSPLPPFPTVHAAAESPVSAYLRYLHNSTSDIDSRPPNRFSGFSPLLSPKWNNPTTPPPPIPPPAAALASNPPFQLPLSPLPFGCLNSPRSPYPLLSPTSGQLGFPVSPTVPVPVPSPRFRG